MPNQGKPLVSVKVVTYNHAPYIRQCIESILMQKTTFPFELVIGEDCSTDGTREIVLDYTQKYPEIIRVVTSESNVGGRENSKRALLTCQGEFIALCEGDDYWIDPLKLQKQFETIIKTEATMVVHSTFVVFYQDGNASIETKIRRAGSESGFLDLNDILSGKALIHTSSFFYRSEILKNMPSWYYEAPVGDLPIKVISGTLGRIYYIDEIMSVYRKGVPGSYTDHKRKSIIEKDGWSANHEKDFLRMYMDIDNFTNHQYTEIIKKSITGRLLFYFEAFGNLDFLMAAGLQNKAFTLESVVVRLLPSTLRRKILRKIVVRQIKDFLQGLDGAILNGRQEVN